MIEVENTPVMCEEARALIIGYLDGLEEYDRVHLMFLSAYRRGNPEAMEAYRSLLQDAKSKLKAARRQFQDHQKRHDCFAVIRFESSLGHSA